MNNLLVLYQKELKNYFYSLSTYLYVAIFVGISMYLYFQTFFLQQQASASSWFQNLPFLLLFFIPALSMGIISEEKKRGTWEILLTLPTDEIQVVLAKFCAGLTLIGFMFALTAGLPLTLVLLGSPDWGIIATSYLGAFLFAGSFLATGIFISSLLNQQTASFIVTLIALFLNDLFSQSFFLLKIPGFLKEIFLFFSLRPHYENFTRGLISLNDITFFFSWIFFFLLLTVISLKSRDF